MRVIRRGFFVTTAMAVQVELFAEVLRKLEEMIFCIYPSKTPSGTMLTLQRSTRQLLQRTFSLDTRRDVVTVALGVALPVAANRSRACPIA